MNILIVGTGAVGGFYGAKLAQGGENVAGLARGPILETLQSRAMHIKSYQGDFDTQLNVVASLTSLPAPDLIILAVKTYATDEALEQIAPIVGAKTILMSLQNGVESEQKMIDRFGAEQVIGAVCYIGAEMTQPGVIDHSADGAVTIGEMNGATSERVQEIHDIFARCGISIRISEDIRKTHWNKLLWNTPFNQVCTIARASVGEALDSEALCALLRATGLEVIRIAVANGIALEESAMEKHIDFSKRELRAVRPSMLQDLKRGKRLEHETFGGYVVRAGQELGVATPVNETLYRFLCYLDPGGH